MLGRRRCHKASCVCVSLSCPLSSLPTPRRRGEERRGLRRGASHSFPAEPIHPSSTSATACYLVSASTCLTICCCPSFRCLLYLQTADYYLYNIYKQSLLLLPAANITSIYPSICYWPLVPLRKRNPAAATYHLSSGTQEPLQCSY